jgi:phosphotransferase system HPr (HPr) family protein
MPVGHIETKNIVFPKRQVGDGSCQYENINSRRTKSVSRTIEATMRHTTLPSSRATHQSNRVEKLEKEITVRKRHYIWSEARFVRAMIPFHSNVRVAYDGKEVDGKSVLDLLTLSAQEGSTVRVRTEGPDAAEAMHTLEQMMRSGLDEA